MTQITRKSLRESMSLRLQSLFVALILFLCVPFVFPERFHGFTLPLAFMLVTLAALASTGQRRGTLILGFMLAIPAVIASWMEPTDPTLAIAGGVSQVVFLTWVTAGLFFHVLRARRVSSDILFGAACVYLLLAAIWAGGYGIADTIEPGAIAVPTEDIGTRADLHSVGGERVRSYFSFVTLTTLGYGDVRPVSDLARILAMLEATLGQLFLVIVVARIVGIHTVLEMRGGGKGTGSPV
jgi:hypothetical protein